MNKIRTLLKNKYVGYLLDLAVVFCAVAILSSGSNFVIDHRVFVLVLLLVYWQFVEFAESMQFSLLNNSNI